MAYPADWVPPRSAGRRTLRFFVEGSVNNTTYDVNHSFYFKDDPGADTFTLYPTVKAGQANHTGGYQTGTDPIDNPTVFPPGPTEFHTGDFIYCSTLRIINDGTGELYFSFDGTNDHGRLKSGETMLFRNRYEAGICLRSKDATAAAYRVEAW